MTFTKFRALTAAAVIGLAVSGNIDTAMAKSMAHAHMGHVTSGWKDTPGKAGLLPTAIKEAQIAIVHAGLAAKKPGDLGWMKTHTKHVMNAIDPSAVKNGPGLGYGVKKAAAGVAKHIGFAAKSADASKNVKAHSVHVSTTANNTVARAEEIMALAKKVEAATSAKAAAPLVAKINMLAKQLLNGVDANGDGKITWKKGEGGLLEAKKHMRFMRKGEKL